MNSVVLSKIFIYASILLIGFIGKKLNIFKREHTKFLNNIIQSELEPIRAKRKEYEKDISAVYDILKAGSENARTLAIETLDEVKRAMKINYFDDISLIQAHKTKYEF